MCVGATYGAMLMALILCLTNISKLAPVSNYRYEVLVGDGSLDRSKVLARGTLTGHTRNDGWQALVAKLLAQETK